MNEGQIVVKYYKLEESVGKGSFGEIWRVINLKAKNSQAIKFEDSKSKHQQLHSECKIYLWLKKGLQEALLGIPNIYYFGIESKKNLMVMDLLGNSLEKLFTSCERKFSLNTLLLLAIQMVDRLSFIHSRGIIHRDIKPDNFVMGPAGKEHILYTIDFGLAKKFSDSDGQHIKFRDGRPLTGTARYASINTHKGIEQSRRDDLESLTYVFVYLLKGRLPWQNLKAKDVKEKYKGIMDKKIETTSEELCEGIPQQFVDIVSYARGLSFTEDPDYEMIIEKLKEIAKQNKCKLDFQYDWIIKDQKRK